MLKKTSCHYLTMFWKITTNHYTEPGSESHFYIFENQYLFLGLVITIFHESNIIFIVQ